jgi:HAMP domain-containing protein
VNTRNQSIGILGIQFDSDLIVTDIVESNILDHQFNFNEVRIYALNSNFTLDRLVYQRNMNTGKPALLDRERSKYSNLSIHGDSTTTGSYTTYLATHETDDQQYLTRVFSPFDKQYANRGQYNFMVVIAGNSVVTDSETEEVRELIRPEFGRYLGIVLPSSLGFIVLTAFLIFNYAKRRVSNPINKLATAVKESKLAKYEDKDTNNRNSANEIEQLGQVFSRFYNEKKKAKDGREATSENRIFMLPEETSLNLLYSQ